MLMFSDIKAASRSDAVYSGRKRGFSQMMSLTDLCIFVLGNHIDGKLSYNGASCRHMYALWNRCFRSVSSQSDLNSGCFSVELGPSLIK